MPRVSELYQEPSQNLPLSDQWAEAAYAHVEAEAAAQLLEDTKSSVFSQIVLRQGDMPVNRAELLARASVEWRDHVQVIVETRQHANELRVKRDYLKMKFQEWIAADANNRTQARL
jgi:hypothetical protein